MEQTNETHTRTHRNAHTRTHTSTPMLKRERCGCGCCRTCNKHSFISMTAERWDWFRGCWMKRSAAEFSGQSEFSIIAPPLVGPPRPKLQYSISDEVLPIASFLQSSQSFFFSLTPYIISQTQPELHLHLHRTCSSSSDMCVRSNTRQTWTHAVTGHLVRCVFVYTKCSK